MAGWHAVHEPVHEAVAGHPVKSLRQLQLEADARNGDPAALDALGANVRKAVEQYNRNPTPANHRVIHDRMLVLRKAEKASQRELPEAG